MCGGKGVAVGGGVAVAVGDGGAVAVAVAVGNGVDVAAGVGLAVGGAQISARLMSGGGVAASRLPVPQIHPSTVPG